MDTRLIAALRQDAAALEREAAEKDAMDPGVSWRTAGSPEHLRAVAASFRRQAADGEQLNKELRP